MERLGASIRSGLDSDLVPGPEREVTPVLTPDLLDVLDELVEVEIFRLSLEPLQIQNDAGLALLSPGLGPLAVLDLRHDPKDSADRRGPSTGEPLEVER